MQNNPFVLGQSPRWLFAGIERALGLHHLSRMYLAWQTKHAEIADSGIPRGIGHFKDGEKCQTLWGGIPSGTNRNV